MDFDEARTILRTQHRAVLATWRGDGTPQLSPVMVGVDEGGHPEISSRADTYKVRNLRRDPRAHLCVFPDTFGGGRWIQLDGTVQIVDQPDAMEPLVAYYRRLSGEHPDWADYRMAMTRDQRVLLRMTISRAGPDHTGMTAEIRRR